MWIVVGFISVQTGLLLNIINICTDKMVKQKSWLKAETRKAKEVGLNRSLIWISHLYTCPNLVFTGKAQKNVYKMEISFFLEYVELFALAWSSDYWEISHEDVTKVKLYFPYQSSEVRVSFKPNLEHIHWSSHLELQVLAKHCLLEALGYLKETKSLSRIIQLFHSPLTSFFLRPSSKCSIYVAV